ncbi:uncharacterized protein LOC5509403 [Nematostella vectensis]|uniref:uncharacterized protein LOC5509403 n=1 Tax=Nematostella vectensis TaxID=45351 RepID=UPI00207777B3|nr:uncharacterized protein LOC5509403 [Nematostella vectensis]
MHTQNYQLVSLTEDDVPGAKLPRDITDCNVFELKRWLECHGQKKGGKKADLQERVSQCIGLGLKIDPKVDGGKWHRIKAEKQSKTINLSSSSRDVDKLANFPDTGWKTFPSMNIPAMFNYGHIYHYLVESVAQLCANDEEEREMNIEDSVTEKPLRKGRSLVTSGFVENIQDTTNESTYFVRAHVHHSMKADLPLKTSVSVSKLSGFVKYCSCSCKANELGRCCHVSALLLFISDYLGKHGYDAVAPSTSKDCQWNKGKKRARNPKPLPQTKYTSTSTKRSKTQEMYQFDPRPAKYHQRVNFDGVNNFVSDLSSYNHSKGQTSMWETVFHYSYSDFMLEKDDIAVYTTLIDQFENNISSALKDLLISVPDPKCCQVPGTEKQRHSSVWFQERWFRITASTCKEIVNLSLFENKDGYKQRLFNWLENKFWFKKSLTTPDMLYGIEEEPKAIVLYEKCRNATVNESGLWVHADFPYLGASPDGLIFVDGKLDGIVEVKCLKILKTRTVKQLLDAASTELKTTIN